MIQPETLYDAYCLAHLQEQMNAAALLDIPPTMDFVHSNPSASLFKGLSSNDDKEVGEDVTGFIDDRDVTLSAEIDTYISDKDDEYQEVNNKSLKNEKPVAIMWINEELAPCVEEDTLSKLQSGKDCEGDLKHDTSIVDVCAVPKDELSPTSTIELDDVEMPFSAVEIHLAAVIHEVLGIIEGNITTKYLQSEGQLLLSTDDKEFVEATDFGPNLFVMPFTNEKSNLVDDLYWTTLLVSAILVQLCLMLTSLAFSSNCNLLKLLPALVQDPGILNFQPKNFMAWRMKVRDYYSFNGPGYLKIWKSDAWSLIRSYDGFNDPRSLQQNHIGAFQFGWSLVRKYDGFNDPSSFSKDTLGTSCL